jgi:transcription initiation factor TFIIB
MIYKNLGVINRSKQSAVLTGLDKCPRCGKGEKVTDNETGEIICGSCGFVISEKNEDYGPEYRSFSDGEDRRRAGSGTSLTRHDMGLATIINPLNKDSTGKSLSPSMRNTISRLRIWDSRSQSRKSSDRNFRTAFAELDKLKDKLSLSDSIIEKTAYIYRKAIAKNIVRGRSISALLGASLYAACRNAETPRTLKDIEEVANVKRKELAKCYRVLVEKLDLKMPVVNSTHCVARISSKLGVTEKTKRLAFTILQDYERSGEIAGKSPTGLAATALYLACVKTGEYYSQKEVANAANVTEVTIRNRGAAIKKTLRLL